MIRKDIGRWCVGIGRKEEGLDFVVVVVVERKVKKTRGQDRMTLGGNMAWLLSVEEEKSRGKRN